MPDGFLVALNFRYPKSGKRVISTKRRQARAEKSLALGSSTPCGQEPSRLSPLRGLRSK
jgi:hypothetical protein